MVSFVMTFFRRAEYFGRIFRALQPSRSLALSCTAKHTACVTGITGYLGSELVTQLLDRGYTVHGTVRRISDARKLDYVMSLREKYPNNLHIYEADILNEDELVHAMDNDIDIVKNGYIYFCLLFS